MNDQNQEPILDSDPSETLPENQPSQAPANLPPPEARDWREQRREERHAHRHGRSSRSYPWLGGVILIFLGLVFLMQNLGLPFLENWWAFFILIPAFWNFVAAWNSYRDNGLLTRGGAGSLAVGILLTLLAAVFLFDLNIGLYWPVFLIAGGLILLGTVLFPARGKPQK